MYVKGQLCISSSLGATAVAVCVSRVAVSVVSPEGEDKSIRASGFSDHVRAPHIAKSLPILTLRTSNESSFDGEFKSVENFEFHPQMAEISP